LVSGKVFKTACGLYVREKAYDDTYFLNKNWVWCHCPHEKRGDECHSLIPYTDKFSHCNPQETQEPYDYTQSIEHLFHEGDEDKRQALEALYEKAPRLQRCGHVRYDRRLKRVRANAAAIKDCIDCPRCSLIGEADDVQVNCRVVCDAVMTVRYDRGDMFGEQVEVYEYPRINLMGRDKFFSRAICERWIKNSDRRWMFWGVDNIRWRGFHWQTIRDVYLAHTPEGFARSFGWKRCDIQMEHTEPYIFEKGKRGTPQMQALKKAAAEAKKIHRVELYRKRISNLLKFTPAPDDSKDFIESRQRKLRVLAEKYPDLYAEELEKIQAKQKAQEQKRYMAENQLSLFEEEPDG